MKGDKLNFEVSEASRWCSNVIELEGGEMVQSPELAPGMEVQDLRETRLQPLLQKKPVWLLPPKNIPSSHVHFCHCSWS